MIGAGPPGSGGQGMPRREPLTIRSTKLSVRLGKLLTIRLSCAEGIRFAATAASSRPRTMLFTASSILDFSPSTDLWRSPATCASDLPAWSWARSCASVSPRYLSAAPAAALVVAGTGAGLSAAACWS